RTTATFLPSRDGHRSPGGGGYAPTLYGVLTVSFGSCGFRLKRCYLSRSTRAPPSAGAGYLTAKTALGLWPTTWTTQRYEPGVPAGRQTVSKLFVERPLLSGVGIAAIGARASHR